MRNHIAPYQGTFQINEKNDRKLTQMMLRGLVVSRMQMYRDASEVAEKLNRDAMRRGIKYHKKDLFNQVLGYMLAMLSQQIDPLPAAA